MLTSLSQSESRYWGGDGGSMSLSLSESGCWCCGGGGGGGGGGDGGGGEGEDGVCNCGEGADLSIWKLAAMTQTQTLRQILFNINGYKYHIRFTCIWSKIQITVYSWYMIKHRHVRRPPLRSDLTAGMEATRRGKACTAMFILKTTSC